MQSRLKALMQMEGKPEPLKSGFTLICDPPLSLLIGVKAWQDVPRGLHFMFPLLYLHRNALFSFSKKLSN